MTEPPRNVKELVAPEALAGGAMRNTNERYLEDDWDWRRLQLAWRAAMTEAFDENGGTPLTREEAEEAARKAIVELTGADEEVEPAVAAG